MKIEAGKTYRTRNGDLCRIVCVDRKGEHYPAIGLVRAATGDDVEQIESYTLDGQYDADRHSSYDLVAEYREPRRFRVWVKNDGSVVLHSCQDPPNERAYDPEGYQLITVQEVLDEA